MFDHCEDRCRFIIYSLEGRTASAFNKPKDEDWINPSFGSSSDKVAFVTRRSRLDGQVAIAKTDGSGFRIVTSSDTIKRSPSFSPDGKSILFVGDEFREAGPSGVGVQDIYLLNLSKKDEQRITDLRVLRVTKPFFLPDGERFVFQTVGGARPRSGKPSKFVELDNLFWGREVFMFKLGGQPDLRPFVHDLKTASSPMPLRTGAVAFISRVNELDGIKGDFVYDIFLWASGESRRHTRFQKYIRTYGISGSGEMVAFVTTSTSRQYKDHRLMLWRKTTGETVELKIPDPTIIETRD